jgi:hypothetical protein
MVEPRFTGRQRVCGRSIPPGHPDERQNAETHGAMLGARRTRDDRRGERHGEEMPWMQCVYPARGAGSRGFAGSLLPRWQVQQNTSISGT